MPLRLQNACFTAGLDASLWTMASRSQAEYQSLCQRWHSDEMAGKAQIDMHVFPKQIKRMPTRSFQFLMAQLIRRCSGPDLSGRKNEI